MVAASTVDLTVDDLEAADLGGLFDAVEDALEDHLSGQNANVAVVSRPLAGRRVLLDYAAEFLGPAADRITLSSVVTDGLPELSNVEVLLVDDCHYLYTRQIGGFDILERFLETVATSDTLFVTSWNRYAWNYLTAVRNVDRDFPVQISIPSLSSAEMANLLTSHYGSSLPEFVDTAADSRVRSVGLDSVSVSLGGERSLDVPRPELNLEYVTARSIPGFEGDVRAVVFEKVTSLSKGDPGVALAIWERSVRDGAIAPAYVQELDRPLDLDDDEAFALEIVLSKEQVDREVLAEVVHCPSIDRVLESLAQQGVVTVDDGTVRIVPELLHTIVEHLQRRQLIW